MIVGDVTALEVVTVLDRGLPNREAIAIHVLEGIDLGQYGLMIGLWNQNGRAMPIHDHMFWFGDVVVEKGDWIFINTGAGKSSVSKTKNGLNSAYSIFWNKTLTLFANSNVVPIIFRVDAVDVLAPDFDLPQNGNERLSALT